MALAVLLAAATLGAFSGGTHGHAARRHDPPAMIQARGRLCFGAARGPRSWVDEVDGPWRPGYWVDIEGGAEDGKSLLVSTENVAPGLQPGDACGVKLDADGLPRCVPLSADVMEAESAFRFERERARWERLVASLAQPVATATAILAFAGLLATFTPTPGAQESRERCERLVSGSIEIGDRRSAERWLATCDLPTDVADELLAERWRRRWGNEPPPSMVQGVPERRL